MTRQSGYALILMVVALMGIGGVVIAGFTQGAKQDAEHQRYLHNQRVLREAKQALLQYAYNYPETNGFGPGRLPCPDTDAPGNPPGTPHPAGFGIPDASTFCNNGGPMVGRFPWLDPRMNFFEAKDASGEHLWYAVSANFANTGPPVINSATLGSITVEDRSGAVLHDGAAATGVAAVIIAPGPPIDRNGVMQVRGTDPEKTLAINYLDRFGAVDNADFDNGADGFITGPIIDVVTGDLLVNDQMIVITAAEVIAMAEKATLQAYREAIDNYLTQTVGVYPWLYNYEGIDYDSGAPEPVNVAIAKLSTYFPADISFATEEATYLGIDPGNNGHFGRIPSTFSDYFTEATSQLFETDLSGSVGITIPQDIACFGCDDGYTLNDDQFRFSDFAMVKTPVFAAFQILTEAQFVDLVGVDEGQLTGKSVAPVSGSLELFFWDDENTPTNVYTPCGDDGDGIPEFTDCNRDISNNPDPGGPNRWDLVILRIEVSLDFTYDAGTNVFNIDMNYDPDPVNPVVPATSNSHALISATFPDSKILYGTMPTISGGSWEIDEHYLDGETAISWGDSGPLDSSGFVVEGPLTLAVRYYPELPAWALGNNWHNSIRMAYAPEYEPGPTTPCVINSTCLRLDDSPGTPQNVISLLVIAGTHDWQDQPVNGRLDDNLDTVFDGGNDNDDNTFYRHIDNDKLLVIEEL
ncbi:MAG: type II secretion system protein [Gammaproteobacteria bacterium]|nr:type II secretion system protein [Gammaproteobacteria bacterium]